MVKKPEETIGQRIASKRTERGLTQEKLAKLLFVSKMTVSKWERNVNSVPADALSKLAEILNTSVDWILTNKGTENFVFSNETGLSDESVEILKAWNNNSFLPYANYLNQILPVFEKFPSFILSLYKYLTQPFDLTFSGKISDTSMLPYIHMTSSENGTTYKTDFEPFARLKIMDELKEMRDWRMKENEQKR